MIYIKTRMRKIPECCAKCGKYVPSKLVDSSRGPFGDGEWVQSDRLCLADGTCVVISGIEPTKERPAWCPLVDREERDND
jgi:hypothetical protein